MKRISTPGLARLSASTLLRWATASLLSVSGVIAAATGIYFLFSPSGGYQGGRNPLYDAGFLVSRGTWTDIHTWSGVAMVVLALVHLVIHWRWLAEMTRRTGAVLVGRRKPFNRKVWARLASVAAVVLPFIAVIASSFYFVFSPGGSGARGGSTSSSFLFSRSTWDLVHTWASVIFIVALAVHLAMRWKWLARVTPSVFRTAVASSR
jgi:hypothetical protein